MEFDIFSPLNRQYIDNLLLLILKDFKQKSKLFCKNTAKHRKERIAFPWTGGGWTVVAIDAPILEV